VVGEDKDGRGVLKRAFSGHSKCWDPTPAESGGDLILYSRPWRMASSRLCRELTPLPLWEMALGWGAGGMGKERGESLIPIAGAKTRLVTRDSQSCPEQMTCHMPTTGQGLLGFSSAPKEQSS
jgi:hypothetical protein